MVKRESILALSWRVDDVACVGVVNVTALGRFTSASAISAKYNFRGRHIHEQAQHQNRD